MIDIISGTPWWAWVALGELLFLGLRATRNRVVFLPTLFIIPGVLLLLRGRMWFSEGCGIYSLCLVMGILLGFVLAQKSPLKILREHHSVELSGSWIPLCILLAFFALKYTFGYLEATQPLLASQYAFLDLGGTGLLSGYFLGRTLGITYRFFYTSKSDREEN